LQVTPTSRQDPPRSPAVRCHVQSSGSRRMKGVQDGVMVRRVSPPTISASCLGDRHATPAHWDRYISYHVSHKWSILDSSPMRWADTSSLPDGLAQGSRVWPINIATLRTVLEQQPHAPQDRKERRRHLCVPCHISARDSRQVTAVAGTPSQPPRRNIRSRLPLAPLDPRWRDLPHRRAERAATAPPDVAAWGPSTNMTTSSRSPPSLLF
jgi:hypothetical protein